MNKRTTTKETADKPGRSAAECCSHFVGLPLVQNATRGDDDAAEAAASPASAVEQMLNEAETVTATGEEKGSSNDSLSEERRQLRLQRLALHKERQILKLSSQLLQSQVCFFPFTFAGSACLSL